MKLKILRNICMISLKIRGYKAANSSSFILKAKKMPTETRSIQSGFSKLKIKILS